MTEGTFSLYFKTLYLYMNYMVLQGGVLSTLVIGSVLVVLVQELNERGAF